MESSANCEYCGAHLEKGWRFCENCGKPVKTPIKILTPTPEETSVPQPSSPSSKTKVVQSGKPTKSRKWILPAIGIGCFGVIVLSGLVLGGYFLLRDRLLPDQAATATLPPDVVSLSSTQTVIAITREFMSNPTVSEPTLPVSAIETTLPTLEPTPTTMPTEVPPLSPTATADSIFTGSQYLDETYLYDDFSSDALGWTVYQDDVTITKYEEEAFSIQVTQQNTFDWVYLPVDFIPYEINFDVRSFDGPQDGTFGVLCQYQDVDNYYYIEIDLLTKDYTIAQSIDDKFIPLTPLNENGQYWQPADQLNEPPTEINQIGVSCYLDIIGLFINNEFVDSVTVDQPFNDPGQAALFVYAFDFAGEAGYKVFFDNVEAFQPVQ